MLSIIQPGNANIGRSEGVVDMSDPSAMLIRSNQSSPEGYFCCNPSLFVSQVEKAPTIYDRIAAYFNDKHCGQLLQAIHHPGFAMFVIFAGEMIFPAQKSPSDTACYAVIVGVAVWVDKGTAGLGHGLFLVELSSAGER